ncbi:recombinase family protein [Aldersonia sp. NBC_00410]|uniref:recombinase family protein n=1 Tax=Aldersonia sp. NBC_00410 TaxID=2975954 RepID=UPI00225336F9|nr:recombinase family protein [Aldersonia sp. NBC_00410]MCX5044823.1 recombinase family protein [Aldersonia sp. NBC_00410]MCX5046310.1 recombinase family protein [Aldersonia sp. NBC_00410]
MSLIGYARVSTTDQNPQLQLDALAAAGVDRVFTDHGVSGSKTSRPQLDAVLDYRRPRDTLVVWKLDRLGRNTQRVGFCSLTDGITTDGPMGRAMLTIMAAFAQPEREMMIERTRAGLTAAAANGRKVGRPRKVDATDAERARAWKAKGLSAPEIARILGVSRATIYRYLEAPAAAVEVAE